jgi:hypothetical protein
VPEFPTTVEPVALDNELLAELRATKAEIDSLQQRLKDLVAGLRQHGASAQEIAEALRG